jgi:hypothetical protein
VTLRGASRAQHAEELAGSDTEHGGVRLAEPTLPVSGRTAWHMAEWMLSSGCISIAASSSDSTYAIREPTWQVRRKEAQTVSKRLDLESDDESVGRGQRAMTITPSVFFS